MGRSFIWVRIRFLDQGWSGRLIPGRSDRIHVHFLPDDGPATLPLGAEVHLGVAQPGMASAMRDTATLVRVDRRREDALECVFEPAHPRRLVDEVRGAVIDKHVENRQWVRALPSPESDVIVPITLEQPATQQVVGRVLDLGAGGVGLQFPLVAEPLLCQSTRVRARVPLPGQQGVGDWVCEVRYRCLLGDEHVRYGLMFASDGVAVDPPGPQLQTLWDCPQCGRDGLLSETHAHCAACGGPRTGPERHPTWQELATVDVHPLCGTDVHCKTCGVAHGLDARFCGHCGSTL